MQRTTASVLPFSRMTLAADQQSATTARNMAPSVLKQPSEDAMISAELERLRQLRDSGALTEAEFQQAKQRVLNGTPQPGAFASSPPPLPQAGVAGEVTVCGLKPHVYSALMHASQLLTWTVLGTVAPIVMWVVGKDESVEVKRQGRIIINWMLSSLIYAIISAIALFVVIGLPMLIVLGALWVVFPIIGAIQAAEGKYWRYPLSIEFFPVDAD